MPSHPHVQRYRARLVFPMAGPPIAGGVVAAREGRLVEVGPHRNEPAADLGDVALLPGLVNAHTHLEFSSLDSPLGEAGLSMAEWIRLVVNYRRAQASPVEACRRGLDESWRCGVRWLGEIATAGWQAEPFERSRLAGVVFAELLGPTERDIEPQLERARGHLQGQLRSHGHWRAGIAPHAPYTVHPELFARSVELAEAHGVPLAFHLAESTEELEYLRDGTGPLRDLLEARGVWQPGAIPPGTRPSDYLRQMARLPRSIIVHGNYLDQQEHSWLAAHADRMALVYCPRTHARFGHAPYPLAKLLAQGICVALGTDSRASNPDLNLWAEVQWVAAAHPHVAPQQVLEMATNHGALALGLPQAGVLRVGALACVVVLPLEGPLPEDPYEGLVQAVGPPRALL
ncbi:MAG: amidohydrolase family protein [Pirellulales bacterium]|nr:amidohydrolase family protein [Pirellulales bacterium]